jgi:hypothetical protein
MMDEYLRPSTPRRRGNGEKIVIILGIVLLLIVWLIAPTVPLPPPIWELVHAAGVILLVVGIILLVLSLIGHPIGSGIGPERNGRRFWY